MQLPLIGIQLMGVENQGHSVPLFSEL